MSSETSHHCPNVPLSGLVLYLMVQFSVLHGVLQSVAVQYIIVQHSGSQWMIVQCSVDQYLIMYCSVLQYIIEQCKLLQYSPEEWYTWQAPMEGHPSRHPFVSWLCALYALYCTIYTGCITLFSVHSSFYTYTYNNIRGGLKDVYQVCKAQSSPLMCNVMMMHFVGVFPPFVR